MKDVNAKIIKTDGTEEMVSIPLDRFWDDLPARLGWSSHYADTVKLSREEVMLVDDTALLVTPLPPINTKATGLYRSVCRPGTLSLIRGNVAIVNDSDFE